jgi:hypothetical protein
MRLIEDYDGRSPSFVHICAMPDEWLRVSPMSRKSGVHRNGLRYWIKKGWLKRRRDGTLSLRAVQKIRDARSFGKNPTDLRGSHLSKREKELVAPFAGPHGVRKFQRTITALAVVARERKWTDAKKKRVAQVLRDGAKEIFPASNDARAPTRADESLLERRERERKRLADASHTRITKKTGAIIYQQAEPATEPGWELIPFFLNGISDEDEKYVLLDAPTPMEFFRRCKERGVRFEIESSDRSIDRCLPKGYKQYDDDGRRLPDEPGYTPDLAAEIDGNDASAKQSDTTEHILAEYDAITDKHERRRFLLKNKKAIHAARFSAAKRNLWQHMEEVARRRNWKWVKTDDGYAFKAIPPKNRRTRREPYPRA